MNALRILIIDDHEGFWEEPRMKDQQLHLTRNGRAFEIEVRTIDYVYKNVNKLECQADVYLVDVKNFHGAEKEANGIIIANTLHKRYPAAVFILVSRYFDGHGNADEGYQALLDLERDDGFWYKFLSKQQPMSWFPWRSTDRSIKTMLNPPPPELFLWQEIEQCISESNVDVIRDFAVDVVHVMPLSAPSSVDNPAQLPLRIRELQAYYKQLKVPANLSDFSTTQSVDRSFMFARRRHSAGLETNVTYLFQRLIVLDRNNPVPVERLFKSVAPSPIGDGWVAVQVRPKGKNPLASIISDESKLKSEFNSLSAHHWAPSKHFFLKFFPDENTKRLKPDVDLSTKESKQPANDVEHAFVPSRRALPFRVRFSDVFPDLVFHIPPKGSECEAWPIARAWLYDDLKPKKTKKSQQSTPPAPDRKT
jgi:hypothetical protein